MAKVKNLRQISVRLSTPGHARFKALQAHLGFLSPTRLIEELLADRVRVEGITVSAAQHAETPNQLAVMFDHLMIQRPLRDRPPKSPAVVLTREVSPLADDDDL